MLWSFSSVTISCMPRWLWALARHHKNKARPRWMYNMFATLTSWILEYHREASFNLFLDDWNQLFGGYCTAATANEIHVSSYHNTASIQAEQEAIYQLELPICSSIANIKIKRSVKKVVFNMVSNLQCDQNVSWNYDKKWRKSCLSKSRIGL